MGPPLDNRRMPLASPKLLAFDTSTEHLSVAVLHGDTLLAHNGVGGAQASATLLPLIQQLLADAGLALFELDAIVFGRGPGSFTGLRTACSVAQGLAFGAKVPLVPVDTLLAVAEEARHAFGAQQVVAALDARMDQIYAARYDFAAHGPLGGDDEPLLLSPEALEVPPGWALAGTAFAAYGPRLAPAAARHDALPSATALLRLAPALLAAGRTVPAAQAWPLYVRDKVAQTTEERAAIKAAAAL